MAGQTDEGTVAEDQQEDEVLFDEGAAEAAGSEDEGSGQQAAAQEEEFSVSMGEEDPEEPHGPAPKWVKEMRKQNRELKRQLRQVQQMAPVTSTQPAVELGEKPTLEKCEYDTKKYEADLAAWYAKKLKIDEQAAQAQAQAEEQQRRWKERLGTYERSKITLGADDFEDAEDVVKAHLDVVQQGILVHGAKNSALLVYALGKNPSKAQALGAIKDPVEFAFAAARLEAQLKVSDRKPATQPEPRVVGSGRASGATDATLERLRAEAEKTDDYTKVSAYKRSKQKRS